MFDIYPIGVYSITMKSNNQTSLKQQTARRLRIIQGQINGLLKMVENDEYCIDVLNQSLAVQSSLKSVDALILEHHLQTHVAKQFLTQPEKAIKELLKIFKHSANRRL